MREYVVCVGIMDGADEIIQNSNKKSKMKWKKRTTFFPP